MNGNTVITFCYKSWETSPKEILSLAASSYTVYDKYDTYFWKQSHSSEFQLLARIEEKLVFNFLGLENKPLTYKQVRLKTQVNTAVLNKIPKTSNNIIIIITYPEFN